MSPSLLAAASVCEKGYGTISFTGGCLQRWHLGILRLCMPLRDEYNGSHFIFLFCFCVWLGGGLRLDMSMHWLPSVEQTSKSFYPQPSLANTPLGRLCIRNVQLVIPVRFELNVFQLPHSLTTSGLWARCCWEWVVHPSLSLISSLLCFSFSPPPPPLSWDALERRCARIYYLCRGVEVGVQISFRSCFVVSAECSGSSPIRALGTEPHLWMVNKLKS